MVKFIFMKNLFKLTFLLLSNLSFSQEMYKVTYDYTDNNNYTCKSYLYTNNKEAVFNIGDLRNGEINKNDGSLDFIDNDELSKFYYSNEKTSFYRFIQYKYEIVSKDDLEEKLNWKINNEHKKTIGKYKCTEAKIFLNGRSFTVWFTYDLALKFGPLKLHKLPGLIVEINEDNGFLKIVLNSITKSKELDKFNTFKDYFFTKSKPLIYVEYEKRIIDIETTGRKKGLAMIKENKWEGIEFLDEVAVDYYIDIPLLLLSELKKLH